MNYSSFCVSVKRYEKGDKLWTKSNMQTECSFNGHFEITNELREKLKSKEKMRVKMIGRVRTLPLHFHTIFPLHSVFRRECSCVPSATNEPPASARERPRERETADATRNNIFPSRRAFRAESETRARRLHVAMGAARIFLSEFADVQRGNIFFRSC